MRKNGVDIGSLSVFGGVNERAFPMGCVNGKESKRAPRGQRGGGSEMNIEFRTSNANIEGAEIFWSEFQAGMSV